MANASKIKIDNIVYDLRDPTKAPKSLVSKTGNGLCPQLPNETTTTKYLRQDGKWIKPPNTTTGATYTPNNLPSNTTFATQGSVKNVYNLITGIGTHLGTSTTENVTNTGWHQFTNGLEFNETGWYILFIQCHGDQVALTGMGYSNPLEYCDKNIYVQFVEITSVPTTKYGLAYFTSSLNNAFCHIEALKICT